MTISTRKITAFQKLIANLADHPNLGSSALLKQYFDGSPEELRVALNGMIDDLIATTAGASGADQIGSASISGLTGATVYAQLVSLKALVDAEAVASGISVTPITGVSGANVQAALQSLKTITDNIVLGTIPDRSLTAAKIALLAITAAEIADGAVTKVKTVNSSLHRGVTFTIAANNSTAAGKAVADYVCDGIDDQTEINNALNALPIITWETGTATAGTANTITLPTTRSGQVDNYYVGYTIDITAGTGSGQSRTITGFVNSTGVATIDSNWTTIPDATSVYAIKSKSGKVILLEGQYSVTNSILVPTNCTLEGQGNGSVIKIANSTNISMSIIQNSDQTNGNSNVTISDLRIDGNKGNQTTGTMNGVYFAKCYYSKVKDCLVGNLRNNGIALAASNNNTVIGNISQGNSQYGIYLSTSNNNTITGNVSQGNSNYGILLSTSSNNNIVTDNISQGNSNAGIIISNVCNNNTVAGNVSQGNVNQGILLSLSSYNNVQSNLCRVNTTLREATAQGGTSTTITLDTGASATDGFYNNKAILIVSGAGAGQRKTITAYVGSTKVATVDTAWTTIPDATSVFRIYDSSTLSMYGIRIGDTGCKSNFVTNNDLYDAGTTANFSDAGTGTVTTAGNRTA